jgi:hypothetical protein
LTTFKNWFDSVRAKTRRAAPVASFSEINNGDVIITTQKNISLKFTLTRGSGSHGVLCYFSHAVLGVRKKRHDQYSDLFILVPKDCLEPNRGLPLLFLNEQGPFDKVRVTLTPRSLSGGYTENRYYKE